MTQYRKKPVLIDAFQWRGEMQPNANWPDWARVKWETMQLIPRRIENCLSVNTLEGQIHASVGDWIIRGIKGEIYPCKSDIFLATYEEVL